MPCGEHLWWQAGYADHPWIGAYELWRNQPDGKIYRRKANCCLLSEDRHHAEMVDFDSLPEEAKELRRKVVESLSLSDRMNLWKGLLHG